MRVLELEITNFGPHEHLLVNNPEDVIGVMGRNGTGKSHVITAIKALLIGDLDGQSSSWVKQSINSDGTLPKFAILRGIFEINGQICHIERKISAGKTGNTRSLKINDGDVITKAKDVDKAIEEVIGVDKYTIANTLFATQGDISNILDCSDAERTKLFTKWFNLGFLGKQYDWLHAKIQELEKSVVAVGPLKDNLTSSIDRYNTTQLEIQKQQEELDAKFVSEQLTNEFPYKYSQYKTYIETKKESENTLLVLQDEVVQGLQKYQCTTLEELQNKYSSLLSMQKTSNELLQTVRKAEQTYSDLVKISPLLYRLYKFYNSQLVVNKLEITNVKDLLGIVHVYYKLQQVWDSFNKVLESSSIAKQWVFCSSILQDFKDTQVAYTRTIRECLPNLEAQQAKLTYEITEAEKSVEKFQKLKDEFVSSGRAICPYCLSEITDIAHTDTELNLVQTKLDKLRLDLNQINAQLLQERALESDLKAELDDLHTKILDISNLSNTAARLLVDWSCTDKYGLSAVIWDVDEESTQLSKQEQLLTKMFKLYSWLHAPEVTPEIQNINHINYEDPLLREHALDITIAKLDAWFKDLTLTDENLESVLPELFKTKDLSSIMVENDPSKLDGIPVKTLQECYTFTSIFSQEVERMNTQQQSMLLDLNTISNQNNIIQTIILKQQSNGSANVVEEFREYLTNLQNTTTDIQKDNLLLLSGSPEQTIEILKAANIQYQQLKVNIECLKRHQTEIERDKQQIENLEKQNEDVYKRIMELQQVLGYLDPKHGSTKQYIRYIFSYILTDVQRYLEDMNATFIVDIDNEVETDLAFKFKPLDKDIWLPMKKLSGGQKITLSIAFLLAIQNVVCPGLCFLVLDEPSTHLDVQSREALCHLIEGIGLTLSNANGQIWLIDHDAILERALKTKIDV